MQIDCQKELVPGFRRLARNALNDVTSFWKRVQVSHHHEKKLLATSLVASGQT